MDFLEPELAHQAPMGALPPVIEVAGNHDRLVCRNRVVHQFDQPPDLPSAVRIRQSKVHADRVQRR